jgi:hypothetical protein
MMSAKRRAAPVRIVTSAAYQRMESRQSEPIPNKHYRLLEVAAQELLFTAKPSMAHAERTTFWDTVIQFELCYLIINKVRRSPL